MSDPKKPGSADLDDLRARLGLSKGGGLGSSKPAGPPAAVPPPAFGPGATPPPVLTGPSSSAPAPASGRDEDRTDEVDVRAPGRGSVPPPAVGRASTPPPPVGRASTPPPPVGRGSVPPPAVGRASTPPPPAASPAAPPQAAPVVAPPFAQAPGASPAASAPAAFVPPPSFGPPKPAVTPPPFGQDEGPEEEVVVREVVVRKLVDDGQVVEDKEVGKVRIGPYVAMAATVALMGVFGTVCGGQIDRAVLANRAIDSADAVHAAITADQERLKNLKSRLGGAARLALSKTEPGPDFELLDHLGTIKNDRPFAAKVWSGQFYQSFKCAPMLFDYYRQMNDLWDLVGDVADRQADPSLRRVLKAWPEERNRFIDLNATDGSSGWAIGFKRVEGQVHAYAGTFEKARREKVGGEDRWRSDVTPLGGGETKTLNEYQPGFAALDEAPEEWFVRVNPDTILGPGRDLFNYGGPLVSEAQDPYLRYLMDVNNLSKALSSVQSTQEQLLQALADIRQERRPFTFGF